jgi:hypothetical protein
MSNFSTVPVIPHPPLKGYRTLIFSGLTMLSGILITIDWGAVIPVPMVGVVIAGIGLLNACIRYFTDTPITVPVPPVKVVAEVLKEHKESIPPRVVAAIEAAVPSVDLGKPQYHGGIKSV